MSPNYNKIPILGVGKRQLQKRPLSFIGRRRVEYTQRLGCENSVRSFSNAKGIKN